MEVDGNELTGEGQDERDAGAAIVAESDCKRCRGNNRGAHTCSLRRPRQDWPAPQRANRRRVAPLPSDTAARLELPLPGDALQPAGLPPCSPT